MIKTLIVLTNESLRQAFLESKSVGRATLVHTQDGVSTNCHGYHVVNGNVSLIKPDMSYILIQEGDVVTYEDGN